MKRSSKMVLLVFCLFTSLLVLSLSQAAPAVSSILMGIYLPSIYNDFDSRPAQLAFIATPDQLGESYIYTMDEHGNGLLNLTLSPTSNLYFVWSPNGSKIAFNSYWGDEDNIYVMNPDGTGLQLLTDQPGSDEFPAWSPDGSRIAFESRSLTSPQIHVMYANGSNPFQLTHLSLGCTKPRWSPVTGANKIAFNNYYGSGLNDQEIYVVNVDGTGLLKLTDNLYYDSLVDWSPDGSKILFLSNRDQGGLSNAYDLYTMNPDGSGVVRLTTDGYTEAAAWSPDGARIAYSHSASPTGLFIMNSDGSDAFELQCQSAPIDSWDFSWSPDGTKIAFSPAESTIETQGLYIARVDNTNCNHITSLLAQSPRWKPSP